MDYPSNTTNDGKFWVYCASNVSQNLGIGACTDSVLLVSNKGTNFSAWKDVGKFGTIHLTAQS